MGTFLEIQAKNKLGQYALNYSHQAPVLIDKFGIAFEIHHRLKILPEFKNSDLLTKNLIKYKKEKILFDLPVSVPNHDYAFIHCCHHAISKSKLNIGPTFLNDLMQFNNLISGNILEEAEKSNCKKDVEFGIQMIKYMQGFEITIKLK